MKSFSAFVLLATAVAVRSATSSSSSTSSSATPTASANPLIPTGISSGCASYLTSLNSDTTLAQCITPIITATSAFGPTGKTASNITSSNVTSALNTLCVTPPTGSCSETTVRTQLANFYTACTAELTGTTPNKDVLLAYDVLYAVMPFKDAVCSKDDSGDFCVIQVISNSSSSGSKEAVSGSPSSPLSSNLWSVASSPAPGALRARDLDVQNQTAFLVPNATTYHESGLPFLLLTPNMDANDLCTPCTRAILTAYITFQQQQPYAPGISASPLLSGEPALYDAVNSTCGASFMTGAVEAAGGLSDSLISGASQLPMGGISTFGTLVAAVAAVFVAVL